MNQIDLSPFTRSPAKPKSPNQTTVANGTEEHILLAEGDAGKLGVRHFRSTRIWVKIISSGTHNTPNEVLKELSLRAFQFLQNWQLPAGYERSCKLSPGNISANRYLLGVELSTLSKPMLDDLAERLEMPSELANQLLTELPEASQLLIGFDGDTNKPTFKVYLEYWERLRSRRNDLLNSNQALRLHLGFKWRCLSPTQFVTTEYVWLPLIKQQQVRDAIDELYAQHQSSTVFAAIGDILNRAYRGNDAAEFIYLQVTEQSTVRESFDLNLYPAGLKVSDISAPLQAVAASMQVPEGHLAKILSLHADQPLGHISAGFGSRGEEYFTFYFETEPD